MEDEYELIPLNPIRRLEKKIETIEKHTASQETIKEVIDIIKSNQEIVEDIVKVNSEMISRVSDLSNDVKELMKRVNDFVSRVEITAAEQEEKKEKAEDAVKTSNLEKLMNERLDKIERRVNAIILSSMNRQKLMKRQ